MPTSIPYDSSLVLGNLIHDDQITALQAISKAEEPVDAAQDHLNNLIQTKHKLDMTLQEMVNMNIPDDQLQEFRISMIKVEDELAKAASDYGAAVVKSSDEIIKAKEAAGVESQKLTEMPESPIDWNKSAIKKMALSSDTMIVDAQYLRNESEEDSNAAHASAVAASASATISSIWGPKYTASTAASVKNTVINQTSKHKIAGTLVITATCTHKESNLFAPFVLDPEKAVSAWNWMYKDDKIETTKPDSMVKAIEDQDAKGHDDSDKVLSLLSGQTIGSSFIGMIHVLQVESTESNQSSSAVSAKVQSEMEWGGFFASGKGSFGLDDSFSDNIKNMLSNSDLTSHCSLVTMGIIPTLKSNNVKTSISQLKPDASDVMKQLSAIQGATDTDVESVSSEAGKAKAGQQFITLNNSYISEVVSNLSTVDNNNNKVIDVNSLMTAFDDYVQKAQEGNSGVPINFFVRHIDKPMICKAWLKKFSPQDNWQLSSGDDNEEGKDDKDN